MYLQRWIGLVGDFRSIIAVEVGNLSFALLQENGAESGCHYIVLALRKTRIGFEEAANAGSVLIRVNLQNDEMRPNSRSRVLLELFRSEYYV